MQIVLDKYFGKGNQTSKLAHNVNYWFYLYYCASQIICLLHYICLFISSIIYLNWQLMANLVSPLEIIHIAEQRRC